MNRITVAIPIYDENTVSDQVQSTSAFEAKLSFHRVRLHVDVKSALGGMKNSQSQQTVCAQFGADFLPPDPDSKVGIALSTIGLEPLNALRHCPEHGTCGWYIWGGEVMSTEAEFFQPLHVHHLVERCPAIVPFLALAPGWRVLLAPGQIEVWHDPQLIST